MLGVKGTKQERERLAAEVRGHALTLTIIGGYLRDAYGGDIRQRDRIKLDAADAEEQGGHAFRAMDAYAEWFESDGERGEQALAMLRLLGLFDRPADARCLAALWRAPPIEGLTELLVGLGEVRRNILLTRLAGAKLVTVNRLGSELLSLDAHPSMREYFANALRERQPGAWKAAHKRLYEHLTATTADKPAPTLDDLQPLYQAIAHGCFAGMQQEACDKVYRDRVSRRREAYVVNKLGAVGADLGAVACFFDPPWIRVSPDLEPRAQAWLLNQAAFRLRALGRLSEALEPMRAAVEWAVIQRAWKEASIGSNNLSELELTLGEVEPAIATPKPASRTPTEAATRFGEWAPELSTLMLFIKPAARLNSGRSLSRPRLCRRNCSPATRCSIRLQAFAIAIGRRGRRARRSWRLGTGDTPSPAP